VQVVCRDPQLGAELRTRIDDEDEKRDEYLQLKRNYPVSWTTMPPYSQHKQNYSWRLVIRGEMRVGILLIPIRLSLGVFLKQHRFDYLLLFPCFKYYLDLGSCLTP
jgi:hypothetical protein